jgi:Glycosyltransferase like family 2
MSAPAVSIAIPCWKRPEFLERTLASIAAQKYPGPVELIVVEDDYDGGKIHGIASLYGAKYLSRPRTEAYPLFQSVSKLWNMCLHACSHDIIILQTDDIIHESPNTIDRLVWHLVNNPKCVATPLIRSLHEDGTFHEWFNHPPIPPHGGRISGTGPHTMWKEDFLRIGGYEEMFYGYGYDDNYMQYLVQRNGLKFDYVEDVMCSHPFHTRLKYEPVTGFANRALVRTLILEIEDGKRQPIANSQPLDIDLSAKEQDIDDIVALVRHFPRSADIFENWYVRCWQYDKNPDHIAEGHRGVACDRSYPCWLMDEYIIEAAWGIIRAKMGRETAAKEPEWAAIANRAADITHTWGSRALAKAHELRLKCAS